VPKSEDLNRYLFRSANTLTRKRPQVQVVYRPPRSQAVWRRNTRRQTPLDSRSDSNRHALPPPRSLLRWTVRSSLRKEYYASLRDGVGTISSSRYLCIHPIRCGSDGQVVSRLVAASPVNLYARPAARE